MIRKLLVSSSSLEALPDGVIKGVFSSENEDEMGDVVVQNGIDLTQFKKNPVVLWNHNTDHPIGTVSDIAVTGGKLQGTVKLAITASHHALEKYNLAKADVIRSFSIGFVPIEQEPIDPKKPWGGQKYLKSQLLELSLVSVPANNDAVITDKKRPEAPVQPEVPPMPEISSEAIIKALTEIGIELVVAKGGKAVSQATASKIADAINTHAGFQAALNEHAKNMACLAKCMKNMDAVADYDGSDQDHTTPPENKGLKPATPGINPAEIAQVHTDCQASHTACMAMHALHTKCMGVLKGMISQDNGMAEDGEHPDTLESQLSGGMGLGTSDTTKPKNVGNTLTKAERLRIARALTFPPA